ncbi:hypothetical protein E2C01_019534 [Portunus trituberculatus]|uniref:Uncharacterized protein n=1 Tax=Portunus trituberculatus TaxID=210409 RepID=A0A5B7DY63_PORTR|nr:hypothetical protein [Portunus trituberculatus]
MCQDPQPLTLTRYPPPPPPSSPSQLHLVLTFRCRSACLPPAAKAAVVLQAGLCWGLCCLDSSHSR